MKISKTFAFDAAHHLPDYKGPCANPHGHTWQVEVVLEGEINKKTGMIMDFGIIKKIVQTKVLNLYDHHDLNLFLPNPTAENIAKHIYTILNLNFRMVSHKVQLKEINIWEAPTSKVTYP